MFTYYESKEPIVLKHTVSSPIAIPGAYNTENIDKELNMAKEGLSCTGPTDPMRHYFENHRDHALFLKNEEWKKDETLFAWHVFTH